MAKNKSLNAAKKAKKDEFYTQLSDIENELKHYKRHFKGKTVLCNCDDPFESKFFEYFAKKFNSLKLKKLIATCYAGSKIMGQQLSLEDVEPDAKPNTPYKAIVTKVYDKTGDGYVDMFDVKELFISGENELSELEGDGSFDSPECLELLDEADIVVTNPPFSRFRDFVSMLVEHDKKFLIIGSQNNITYKEIFPLLKDNKMWLGYGFKRGDAYFAIPKDCVREYAPGVYDEKTGLVHFRNCNWYTNLDHKKRHEPIDLYKRYDPDVYPSYINFDGIECRYVTDIPCDYAGNIGVTPGFMADYSPEQFEIVGSDMTLRKPMDQFAKKGEYNPGGNVFYYKDPDPNALFKYKAAYKRVVIRNLHPEEPRS